MVVVKDHITLQFTREKTGNNLIRLIKIPQSLDLNDLQVGEISEAEKNM